MTSLADYVKEKTSDLQRYRKLLKRFPDATIDLKLGEPCWDEDDEDDAQSVKLLICAKSAGPQVTSMHIDDPDPFRGFRVEYPSRKVWFWVETPAGNVFTDPPSFIVNYHEGWEEELRGVGIPYVDIERVNEILSGIDNKREEGREFNSVLQNELNNASDSLRETPPDVKEAVACLERAAQRLSQGRLCQYDVFLDIANDIWNQSPSSNLARRLASAVDTISRDLKDGRIGYRRAGLSNILHSYIRG
jgi:hypothetical protein